MGKSGRGEALSFIIGPSRVGSDAQNRSFTSSLCRRRTLNPEHYMKIKLGFDSDFDLTGADTRAQAKTRLIVGLVVFCSSLTVVDWRVMLLWAATFAFGDGLLWIATDPRRQGHRPVEFRVLRLAATLISTCAWVSAGVLWWFSDGGHGQAAGVALIGGVLIYMIRGCHRSLIQMLVTGVPPTVALLILPLFEATWKHKLGLLACTGLLVAYAVSSAVSAVRSYVQLRKTTAALMIKQQEAEAASIAKGEFLANMSHEIRTPLNGIVAMAHVMAMAPLPPREKEAAKLICSSGQTLERLLSDILDLAKVEAGQLEIQLSSFHLGSLVQNATSLARVLAEEKGLRLATTIDDTADCIVTGDEVRITQILTNLISNAVKFTSHGLVSISLTKTPEGRFRFCVEDTGLGFGEDEKSRIFDRFQQADGTITRRFGGSGLGLSISRHLVDMMGGTLDCESTPGAGSLFWFELDLPADEAAALAEEPARTGPIMAKRLLVVDDHPTNLTVVQIILDGAGISVTTATDGQAALSAWEAASFDLILMDMQMPVMDGLPAVREIRAVEGRTGRRTTPIIMLTANASADHILASSEAGADGHLTKPISPASLFSSIEAALANREVFLQNSNSEAALEKDESEESPKATRI
jgi:signal transduction histidine kinase/CheY-like chemotaxis protein